MEREGVFLSIGRAFSAVRDIIRHSSETKWAHPSSYPQFCSPTSSEGFSRDQPHASPLPRLWASARVCSGPPPEVSTYFSDASRLTTAPRCWLSSLVLIPSSSRALPFSPTMARASCGAEVRAISRLFHHQDRRPQRYLRFRNVFFSRASGNWLPPKTIFRRDVLGRMLPVRAATVQFHSSFFERLWRICPFLRTFD